MPPHHLHSLLHICSPCHSLARTLDESSNVLTLAQGCAETSTHLHTHVSCRCINVTHGSGAGWSAKRIDEQIVELSIRAGEGLLVELKVKGSIPIAGRDFV